MKKFILSLFEDSNNLNEKSIVGFISFLIMIIAFIIDLIKGYTGQKLIINEFIFNGFLVITLGSFGIASIDKFINKTTQNNNKNQSDT